MRIGFTGTREGMTVRQWLRVGDWMRPDLDGPHDVTEIHHGCCLGADSEFQTAVIRNRIGESEERQWAEITAHPCDMPSMVCRNAEAMADNVLDPKPPLERNRDIVDAADVLLAAPKGPEEQRSGTWSTIRFARRQGKSIVIFWPDGTLTEEPAT